MSKILICAIPFGCGPIGKALVIADHLRSRHEVILASFSHGIQLLRNSAHGLFTIDMGSRSIYNLKTLLDDGVDILISVMDMTLVKMVKQQYPGVRVIFVDSLLSWRLEEYPDDIWEDVKYIDLYISQYVPDLSIHRINDAFKTYKGEFHTVAPILKKNEIVLERGFGNEIVIHIGGVSSPVINYDEYIRFIRFTISLVLKHFSTLYQVHIVSTVDVTRVMESEFQGLSTASFKSLSYDEFQRIISRARLLLTTPGIETVYESIALGCPLVLLPPLNSTQLRQFSFFCKYGFANVMPPDISWLLDNISNSDVPYKDKTFLLSGLVDKLAENEYYGSLLKGMIDKCMSSSEYCDYLRGVQERILPDELENGLDIIASFVEVEDV